MKQHTETQIYRAEEPETSEESADIASIRAATKREVEELMRNTEESFPVAWTDVFKLLKTKPRREADEIDVENTYRKKATPQDPDSDDLITRINLACAKHDIAIEITPDPSERRSRRKWVLVNNTVQITEQVPEWLKKLHRGLNYMKKNTQSPAWKALLGALIGKYEGVPVEELEELPEILEYSAGLKGLISNINIWGLKGTEAKIHIRNGIVIVGAQDEIPIVRKERSNDPEWELQVLRTQRERKQQEVQVSTLLAVEYSERWERAKRILAKIQGRAVSTDEEQKPKKPSKEELDSTALPQSDVERLQIATRTEALGVLRGIDWENAEKEILGIFAETRQAKEENVEKINTSREDPISLIMLRTLMNLRLARFGLQIEVNPDPAGNRSNNRWNLQVADTVILHKENDRIRQLHQRAETVTGKIRSKTVRTLLEKLLRRYGGVQIDALENEPAFAKYGGGLRMLITNTNNQNLAQFGLEIKVRNGMAILGHRHEGILAVAPPSGNIADDIARERASLVYATQELKAAAELAAGYCQKMLDVERMIEQSKPIAPKPTPKPRQVTWKTARIKRHRPANGNTETLSLTTPETDDNETEEPEEYGRNQAAEIEPAGLDGEPILHRDGLRTAIQNEAKAKIKEGGRLSTGDLDAILEKLDKVKVGGNLEDLRKAYREIITRMRAKAENDGTISPAVTSRIFSVPA